MAGNAAAAVAGADNISQSCLELERVPTQAQRPRPEEKHALKKNSLLTTTGLNFLKSPMKLDTQNFLKIDFLCSKLNEILF